MSRFTRRPSPALIVAVVALIAAFAGTSIADPGASTSKITKKKVKKVAKKQVNKAFPVSTGQIGDSAVTTPKLGSDAVTAPKLGAINTREVTVSVVAGSYGEATADCQPGEEIISGGAKWDNAGLDEFLPILESHKTTTNGWYVRVQNAFGSNRNLTVEAYCLAA